MVITDRNKPLMAKALSTLCCRIFNEILVVQGVFHAGRKELGMASVFYRQISPS